MFYGPNATGLREPLSSLYLCLSLSCYFLGFGLFFSLLRTCILYQICVCCSYTYPPSHWLECSHLISPPPACLSAFATVTLIVKAETRSSRHYVEYLCLGLVVFSPIVMSLWVQLLRGPKPAPTTPTLALTIILWVWWILSGTPSRALRG